MPDPIDEVSIVLRDGIYRVCACRSGCILQSINVSGQPPRPNIVTELGSATLVMFAHLAKLEDDDA